MSNKPILLVDFDGVCHSYVTGWQGADVIPDAPVPGLEKAFQSYLEHFDVQIYSARTKQEGGREAMVEWFDKYFPSILHAIKFPEQKPAAFLTIDDRAITFIGEWPAVETLRNFKTWNDKAV
jgi:hypothetical protein